MNYAETVFFQRLKKVLHERHAVLSDAVTSGVGTWDEYQRLIGCILGLQEANDIADSLRAEMEKE